MSEPDDRPSLPQLASESAAIDHPDFMAPFLRDPGNDLRSLVYGEVVEAIVVEHADDRLVFDLGFETGAFLLDEEYSRLSERDLESLPVGSSIAVSVVNADGPEGGIVVSIARAKRERRWLELEATFEADEILDAMVVHANDGGVSVSLGGIVGFVPLSLLPLGTADDHAARRSAIYRLVGTRLPMMIKEFDWHREHIILSVSDANRELRKRERRVSLGLEPRKRQHAASRAIAILGRSADVLEELNVGEIHDGRVTGVVDYGAFVEIEGVVGLVHRSELCWGRLRHPSDLLSVDDDVTVVILSIDREKGRLGLSLKRAQEEPWTRVGDSYVDGQLVRGEVVEFANFGAFVQVEDGIEALIHITEMLDDQVLLPDQILAKGQHLIARIIRLDPEQRRMGLSLRSMFAAPDAELTAAFGPGVLDERAALRQAIETAIANTAREAR